MILTYGLTPLVYLLGYFHLDFRDVTGDERETVATFLRENPELALPLADQTSTILERDPTEDELSLFAVDAGCDIDPRYIGGTFREWFASIAAQARAYAAEHPQP